jgi:hypothetical protein
MRQDHNLTAILYFTLALLILPTAATANDLLSFGGSARVASDDVLNDMRGGLSLTPDFTASFGITRTISVNGDVVATQGLMLRDLGNLFKGGMPTVEQLGKALTIVQIGPNNYAAGQPTIAGVGGSPSAATGSTAGQPTSASAVSSNSTPASSGSGSGTNSSFAIPGVAGAGIAGTFANAFAAGIQNSLNDVRISTRTQIDAQIGSMGLFRSNLTSSLLRDNLVGSGLR